MTKIKKILIGTNNSGKFKEISDLLPDNIVKISPETFKLGVPIENGNTFLENSKIKAKYFCEKTKLITLSDDSGLEVDCLGGQPGIYSSRWADNLGGFKNAMDEIVKKVKEKNKTAGAQFTCSLTIWWPNGKNVSEEGVIKGNISSIKGRNGFGYDPIFTPVGYKKTFGEMSYKEKFLIDHRYIAYKKLENRIKDYF